MRAAGNPTVAETHPIEAGDIASVHGVRILPMRLRLNGRCGENHRSLRIPLAPLHNPANLAGIRAAQAAFPTCPSRSRVRYCSFMHVCPNKHGVTRSTRGPRTSMPFAGTDFMAPSCCFVATQAAQYLERPWMSCALISLHLGNGASACAIEFGHSAKPAWG